MSEINYKKIIAQLIKEYPHDLDTIEKVINDAKGEKQDIKVDYSMIIKSKDWSKEEKIRLLKMSRYNPYNEPVTECREHGELSCNTFVYMVEHDLADSFDACLEVFYSYEESYIGRRIERVDAYTRIINMIFLNTKGDLEKRTKYLTKAIESASEEMLNKVFKTSFQGDVVANLVNESIFPIILSSLDTKLIGKCLKYVDDISFYLPDAVSTGSKEVVTYLLDNGADINYLYENRAIKWLTPLKTAIKNNDYEMYLFLKSKGAKIDAKVENKDFEKELLASKLSTPYLNYNAIENLKDDENLKSILKFNRCSTPLEFATSLDERHPFDDKHDVNQVFINFKFATRASILNTPTWEDNYACILDDILEIVEENSINYTEVLIAILATSNPKLINKYTSFIASNHKKFNLKSVIQAFISLRLYQNADIRTSFIKFLKYYDPKDRPFSILLNEYYNNSFIESQGIYYNDFLKEVIANMPKNIYLRVPLIVHAKDVSTVKSLEELGYDINERDDNGFNILFNLLASREPKDELDAKEVQLFEYLIKKVDLTSKDKAGHNILYYMMRIFDTKDEYLNANPNAYGPKNNLEIVTARIIKELPEEEVCREEIVRIFDKRIDSHIGYLGGWINSEYVYQHHKKLFDSLIDKNFPFSDAFYENLFSHLYPNRGSRSDINSKIDVDATREYVFEHLDRNTEIQKINITKSFNALANYLTQQSVTTNFEEFARMFIDFNNEIVSLKEFLSNVIPKKANPTRYLEYVKEKYGVTYSRLDDYLLTTVIRCLVHFPEESIETVLSLCPNLDINHRIKNKDIGYPYKRYKDSINKSPDQFQLILHPNENGNVDFSGGLVQYAILSDNLSMLKYLEEMGANLEYIDGANHTWDTVNSSEIKEYMESVLGNKEYASFSPEDRKYYLRLTGNKKNEGE